MLGDEISYKRVSLNCCFSIHFRKKFTFVFHTLIEEFIIKAYGRVRMVRVECGLGGGGSGEGVGLVESGKGDGKE